MSVQTSPTAAVAARPAARAWRPDAATTLSLGLLGAYIAIGVLAPFLVGDYISIDAVNRLRPPGPEHWFGTDQLGRDIFARSMVGTGNSLLVGLSVALLTTLIGASIGLVAGYFRAGEWAIMRLMDALMAIPSVLLAIALAALMGAGLTTVIIAITVPEIPRMVRLVRSSVLSLRDQPFITAAIGSGTRTSKILFRHILPNTVGTLAVQATYVCSSAILTEAVLSFLGIGSSPDSPSWGSIMAGGRVYFQISPWILFFPGLMLSVLVLTVNILGDSLRDALDPRVKARGQS